MGFQERDVSRGKIWESFANSPMVRDLNQKLDCEITIQAPTPDAREKEGFPPQFYIESIPSGNETSVNMADPTSQISTGRLSEDSSKRSIKINDMRSRPYVDKDYIGTCGETLYLKSERYEPAIHPDTLPALATVGGVIAVSAGLIVAGKWLVKKIPPAERITPDGVRQRRYYRRYAIYDPIYGYGGPVLYRDRERDFESPVSAEPIFDPPEAARTGGPSTFGQTLHGDLSEHPGQDIVVEPTVMDRLSGEVPYQDEDAIMEAQQEEEAAQVDLASDDDDDS